VKFDEKVTRDDIKVPEIWLVWTFYRTPGVRGIRV
jgi:hypothetical protein